MSNVAPAIEASRLRGERRTTISDRVLGEDDVAVVDVLEQDARGEGRDRLVAQRPPRPPAGASSGSLAQQVPLVGVLGEQADAPARAGSASCRRRRSARSARGSRARRRRGGRRPGLGGDQRGDQVVAGRRAASLEQLARVLVELLDRAARSARARPSGVGASNWRWIQLRPVVQPRRVLERRAHHGRDRSAPGTASRTTSTNSQRPAAATGVPAAARGSRASPGASGRRRAA